MFLHFFLLNFREVNWKGFEGLRDRVEIPVIFLDERRFVVRRFFEDRVDPLDLLRFDAMLSFLYPWRYLYMGWW